MLTALMIPIGLWFLTMASDSTAAVLKLIFIALGVFILLVVVMTTPFTLMRLANKAPGLIIDERGITDHSAILSNGFVAWSDIKAIEVGQPEQTTMLFVVLFDPEKYLRTRTRVRRVLARLGNRVGYPSSFGIVIGNLNIEFSELVTQIEKYWGDFSQRADIEKISG